MPQRRTIQDEVGPLATLLEALGDERRLRAFALLTYGELCVCHFETALALSQPEVSRQLGILRRAGIVTARREGSWVHYRLATQEDPLCQAQVDLLIGEFKKRSEFQRDVARLAKSGGPVACR